MSTEVGTKVMLSTYAQRNAVAMLPHLASIILCLFFSSDAHAFGGALAKIFKQVGNAAPVVDELSKISSRQSNGIHTVVRTTDGLEAQTWVNGEIHARFSLHDEQLTAFLIANNTREFVFRISDIANFQPAILNVTEQTVTDFKAVDELGNVLPIIVRNATNGPSLAIKWSSNISFSLDAWPKRSMLYEQKMAVLIERMRVIVLAPPEDVRQRQAFTTALGDNVVFVDSNASLRQQLDVLHKQFVVIVGHVEGPNFSMRSYANGTSVQAPVAELHHAIDQRESVGLLLGCRIGCQTAFTGPEADIDALKVVTGLKDGVVMETTMSFLHALANQMGHLHITEDIYGRLRVASQTNANGDRKVILGATAIASGEVLLPKRIPTVITPGVAVVLQLFFLFSAWVFLWVISLGEGILFIWERYVRVSRRSDYNIAQPKSGWHTLLILLGGPYLVLLSFYITLLVLPFMLVMKIISWLSSIRYPSAMFFRLRWLPLYLVHLLVSTFKRLYATVRPTNAIT